MLTSLSISNFAIIKQLNIDIDKGMTVITGETGAGKSIAIDALSLCMGYRSDVGMIRAGANQASVTAVFAIDVDSIAYNWLNDKSLLDPDEPQQLIIRRVINTNGPSKAYINEHPVSITFLKELTQYLVHLHGQHAPQLLLKPSYQLVLVDRFVNRKELLDQVRNKHTAYKNALAAYNEFVAKRDNYQNTKQLLEYKHNELAELNLKEGEFDELEHEWRLLSSAQQIEEHKKSIVRYLNEGQYNVSTLLSRAYNHASDLVEFDQKYQNLAKMLDEALTNINEASDEAVRLLNDYLDVGDIASVEARMEQYNRVAKKNNVLPENLYDFAQDIAKQLAELTQSLGDEDELVAQLEQAKQEYFAAARVLHDARVAGAQRLAQRVEDIMKALNLENAQFYIDVDFDEKVLAADGSDSVQFMLNSNLGQQAQELQKVASGGELSRIALAIQLLTASHLDNGTLIFDEVDVGISGKTATVVGRIIRQLAARIQVISVTHLAQVAAYANNHFQVEKFVQDNITNTRMSLLTTEQRVKALASLIGHENLNQAALDNAQNLLELSQNDDHLLEDIVTGERYESLDDLTKDKVAYAKTTKQQKR